MRRRLLKILMVLLVLIPVGLSIYLANTLYHRKGVPEALDALSKQLFQSKQEENKAEKRAEALERKTAELQSAYDALVADLRGEVDSKEVRVRRFGEKLEINFVDKVLFDSGSAVVTPHGREILGKVASGLKRIKDKGIYVVGHTDTMPIRSALFPSNWELSTSRAAAVIRFLSETGGVPPERLTAMGRAFYQPVASNATPEGRQENRRVEIIVADIPLLTGEAGSQSLRGTVSGDAAAQPAASGTAPAEQTPPPAAPATPETPPAPAVTPPAAAPETPDATAAPEKPAAMAPSDTKQAAPAAEKTPSAVTAAPAQTPPATEPAPAATEKTAPAAAPATKEPSAAPKTPSVTGGSQPEGQPGLPPEQPVPAPSSGS